MIAVAGATGYIGGLLSRQLREAGEEVRALARQPERAGELTERGCDVREADVLDRSSLDSALRGVDVAYYLVHSMGRGPRTGTSPAATARGPRTLPPPRPPAGCNESST